MAFIYFIFYAMSDTKIYNILQIVYFMRKMQK